jgi:hypothetical protein
LDKQERRDELILGIPMPTRILLILLILSLSAFGQTTSQLTPPLSNRMFLQRSSIFNLEKLKTKFKINYFSETLGPSLSKWDDNEISDLGLKNREPVTMYHSFNIRYLTTEKFNLFMGPRFNTVIGDRNDLRSSQEQNVFYSDDWLFGFFYTLIKSPKFQYNQRLTHREPFSKKSRFENINSQIEWQHDYSYAFTPALRAILWNNYRFYSYNKNSTEERYRINLNTLLNYMINDKWNVQFMHELDLQHRNTTDVNSSQHRDLNYMKRNKNYFSFGVGYSPVQNLTFTPFIRAFDERNIRNETTIIGMWILGRIL